MALDQKTDGVWKSGKGKGRKTPKGRQVNEDAISDVKLLLGNRERRADLAVPGEVARGCQCCDAAF